MHIALLMANTDESAFAQARPKDGAKWARLLSEVRPDWRLSVFAVKDGVFPDRLDGVDGWIISGSPASANDPDPWVDRLLALIRDLAGQGAPLFGACFGHQAIARALGGKVGANPGGFVLGCTQTLYHAPEPWMVPGPVSLYAAHGEQVLALPHGARVLAGNADCAVGAFAIGPRVLTTQYHPEITEDFMADLLDELKGKLPDDVLSRARESLARPADRALMAGWIAAFFERG
ncbi:MAG: type 1 glutamine amidotransferase [Gemmobacter sp.]|nr:type 1 glutamine amidotransferase [Gemmobacter sp.]